MYSLDDLQEGHIRYQVTRGQRNRTYKKDDNKLCIYSYEKSKSIDSACLNMERKKLLDIQIQQLAVPNIQENCKLALQLQEMQRSIVNDGVLSREEYISTTTP